MALDAQHVVGPDDAARHGVHEHGLDGAGGRADAADARAERQRQLARVADGKVVRVGVAVGGEGAKGHEGRADAQLGQADAHGERQHHLRAARRRHDAAGDALEVAARALLRRHRRRVEDERQPDAVARRQPQRPRHVEARRKVQQPVAGARRRAGQRLAHEPHGAPAAVAGAGQLHPQRHVARRVRPQHQRRAHRRRRVQRRVGQAQVAVEREGGLHPFFLASRNLESK